MNDFENMLINLKVLQSLTTNVRLDTTETLFRIHSAGAWVPTFLKRWWAQQSRLTDITRVQALYKNATKQIEENHDQTERIKQYLVESKKGLLNLKTTYRNDPTVMALIDVILDSVSQTCSPGTALPGHVFVRPTIEVIK
jgi:hypothetical protein